MDCGNRSRTSGLHGPWSIPADFIAAAAIAYCLACGNGETANVTTTTTPPAPATEPVAVAKPPVAAPPVLAGGQRLLPRDEAASDPSFFEFRKQLIAAVEERNREVLLASIDDAIKTDFGGGGGKKDFIEHWKLDQSDLDSPVWVELLRILQLGGSFRDEGPKQFWAPYVYSDWPESIDSFENVAAVGSQVIVRTAPEDDAKGLATLDHHIVAIAEDDPMRSGTPSPSWRKIVLPDKREGWVIEDEVRSPIDYRAGFEKKNGVWKMTILVAGD